MGNSDKTKEFLRYVGTPLSKNNISLLYSENNIKYDRCQLYLDFILTLFKVIQDTYMGDDITKGDDIINHFNWCWDRTIELFAEEEVFFDNSNELKTYFLNFMLEMYYPSEDKSPDGFMVKEIGKHWEHIFGYGTVKTQLDVDTFFDLYSLFEKTL